MLATSREARVFQEEQLESGNYNWKAIWNENTSQWHGSFLSVSQTTRRGDDPIPSQFQSAPIQKRHPNDNETKNET